jgi:signal transduction histidine kinase
VGDGLELTVTNPLVPGAITGSGHGIVGMRERVALLGGSLDAGPQDGRFRVHANLPLEP